MKAKEIRQRAWNALKGRYWWAVLAALISWLFGVISFGASSQAVEEGGDVANGSSEALQAVESALNSLSDGAIAAIVFAVLAALLIGVAMSIIGGAIKLGYCRFNMDLFTDVEKPTMNLLFSRLGIIWKAFWLGILKGLVISLGYMVFVVPGVILHLAYSQSEYIMAENPELKAKEAMKQSRELMKGNKWSYCCLVLSFIGWFLLAGIVPAGNLLLTPYTEAADAAFYLDRTGRLSDGAKDLGEIENKA